MYKTSLPLLLALGPVHSGPASAQCELQRLVPSDAAAEARFGAALDISGDRALIAALQADGIGAAYVYERGPQGWGEAAKLSPSDGVPGDCFGIGLALDGDLAVVGALEASGSGPASGKAYAFEYVAGQWVETQILLPGDSAPGDWFGVSVALSGDWLAVGARQDSTAAAQAGSAYVYRRVAGVWEEFDELLPGTLGPDDRYGHGLALHGTTLAVGASGWDGPGTNAGSVFLWDFDGVAWNMTQRVRPVVSSAGNFFGLDVDLGPDRLLVGARGYNGTGPVDRGAAYVFERSAGLWSETALLTHTDANGFDEFGNKVALWGDQALIGCWLDSDGVDNAGAAYVFERTGSVWEERAKLAPSTPQASALFGHDVDVHGEHFLVGAYRASVPGQQSGAVYVADPYRSPGYDLFCAAQPNSTGGPASIHVAGGLTLSSGDSVIEGTSLPPGQPALLFYSSARQAAAPWGDGHLCLSSAGLLRISPPLVTDSAGGVAFVPDLSITPIEERLSLGAPAFVQWVYRDRGGGSGANTSDAAAVRFCR